MSYKYKMDVCKLSSKRRTEIVSITLKRETRALVKVSSNVHSRQRVRVEINVEKTFLHLLYTLGTVSVVMTWND